MDIAGGVVSNRWPNKRTLHPPINFLPSEPTGYYRATPFFHCTCILSQRNSQHLLSYHRLQPNSNQARLSFITDPYYLKTSRYQYSIQYLSFNALSSQRSRNILYTFLSSSFLFFSLSLFSNRVKERNRRRCSFTEKVFSARGQGRRENRATLSCRPRLSKPTKVKAPPPRPFTRGEGETFGRRSAEP